MQGDLISRSDLIEAIRESCGIYNGTANTLIRFIEKQPTTYSTEKVVAELEEVKMEYFLTIANTGDDKLDFAYEKVGNALDRAIEIVRNGGKE